MPVEDGTLVQGNGSSTDGKFDPANPSKIYIVEGGRRRVIHNRVELLNTGLDASQVKIVEDAELEKIPLAEAAELAAGQQLTLDLTSFLGWGHYMRTWGVLRKTPSGGHIDSTTQTWTITAFGGFHGAVNVLYSDAEDFPVGMTATMTFGVDGTWIGRSNRTDYWAADLTPDQVNRTTKITIAHFWNPSSLQDQIAKLVAAVKPLADIIATIVSAGGKTKSSP